MHAALRVQEILLNIFGHCYSPLNSLPCGADLAALARTCCTFKEPALDILWSELMDLSPISRCLPEVCHEPDFLQRMGYGFSRSPQEGEWRILRGYTRRIWRICMFGQGLYWESVKHIVIAPTSEPLFPNLRYLRCVYKDEVAPLLCLPLPSLTTLSIKFFEGKENFKLFQDIVESLAKFSPNISNLEISASCPVSTLGGITSNHVCCWSNLRKVDCDAIALGVDVLVHLSRMPTLDSLSFTLSTTLLTEISSLDPPLKFSGLHAFFTNSEFLASITSLLSHIQLPTITSFGAYIHACPSKENLASFIASLQGCAVTSAIKQLQIIHVFNYDGARFDWEPHGLNPSILCVDDLRPLTSFKSLETIDLDLPWDVGLVDSELLSLGQAWRNLFQLSINREWGWITPRITPQGLAELVRTCPSLTMIDLAIDTRGFTELPPNLSPNLTTSTGPHAFFSIDVIDSVIEEESIPAMTAFMASIVRHVPVYFLGWQAEIVIYPGSDEEPYERRWKEVYTLAEKMVKKAYSNLVKTSGASRIDAYFLEDEDV